MSDATNSALRPVGNFFEGVLHYGDLKAENAHLREQLAQRNGTELQAADAQRELKELKAKRAETSKKLNDLGRATAQSWDATKQGFADAYKDLQQAYDKAVASLKK